MISMLSIDRVNWENYWPLDLYFVFEAPKVCDLGALF